MITVQDLLDMEEFGLTLLAGEAGVSRPVAWAHSAEITDVSDFLNGNELILSTGLSFPESREEQLEYLDSLAAAGAAGLGLGTRRPELTPEFLARADELRMPVMHTAWVVPYSNIARWVASCNSENYQRNLELQLRILEVLRWQSEHNAAPRAVVERLEKLTKTRIFVSYEDGSSVFIGMPERARPPVEAEHPLSFESARNTRRLKLPITSSKEVFLTIDAMDPEIFSYGGATQQLSSAISVLVMSYFHEHEYSRRFQAELLSAFLSSGSIPPGALRMLQSIGFSENDSSLVLAVMTVAEDRVRENLASRLQMDLSPALILTQQNELIVLTTPAQSDGLRPSLDRFDVKAGISSPFPESEDLHIHLGQARWAAQYGQFGSEMRLVRFEDIEQFNPWLNLEPSAMDQVVRHVLGTLVQYDRRHGTELVTTLGTYFRENRSLKTTAERLIIHPQTLRYRLKRIQEITGRDLDATQNLAEFWWALSMLDARAASPDRTPQPR